MPLQAQKVAQVEEVTGVHTEAPYGSADTWVAEVEWEKDMQGRQGMRG